MSETQPLRDNAGEDTNIKTGTPPAAPIATQPLTYQPISGWAIAGLALGSMFALLVVLCAILSFYLGAPFFLYQWLVGLALAGVFVSLYAQRHVRASEGALAGAKLAQWGFRLSLVSGLLYCVYYFMTGIAVTSQANDFVMEETEDGGGFFPRLKKGGDQPIELNKAFLLTQPPNARTGRPDSEANMRKYHDIAKDGASGFLTQFRESSFLARILYKQLGKDAEITPKGGVQDWKYENRSYVIERVYHIKTKEIELDFLLVVQSVEAESAGQGRKWFVYLPKSHLVPNTVALTPIGEGLRRLRLQAYEFLAQEFRKHEDGSNLLDFQELGKGTPWEALAPKDHKERRERVLQAFAPDSAEKALGFQGASKEDLPGKWEQVAGKIRVYPLIKFAITKDKNQLPSFQIEAVAEVETKEKIDPATIRQDSPPVAWELRSLNITAMTVPEDKKPPPDKK